MAIILSFELNPDSQGGGLGVNIYIWRQAGPDKDL